VIATPQISGVITTFADVRHAKHYVEELKRAGFRDGEVEMHVPHGKALEVEEDALAGAISGGMVGAVAGVVATGLIPGAGAVIAGGLLAGALGGAAAGAAAGGILGALVGLGLPEDQARRYEEEFLAGRTLVVVQALGRGGEALDILRRCQADLKPLVPHSVSRFPSRPGE
jgi:hypothetical protein